MSVNQLVVDVKLLDGAREPFKATYSSAGYDLFAYKTVTSEPKSVVPISTGCIFQIPQGYFGRILPRSGLALRNNLTTDAGVIDSDFRGVVHVLLRNNSDTAFVIEQGQRIAQIVYLKCEDVIFVKKSELSESERGINGFGSTGK